MTLRIATITVLLILALPAAYALAPEPPSIFIFVSPDTQDVAAGGSAEIQITVLPQGTWVKGEVSFELMDPPEGVTVTFDPNTVEFADEAHVIMTVEVATDASQGNVVLKVVGSGRECCWQGNGKDVDSDVQIQLNVGGSEEKPEESEQPANVVTVTVTITSISFRTISTTTVVSSVTSTVTEVITTKTPGLVTSTTVEQLSPAGDLTLPAVMFGGVVILLSVAFVALRRKS